VDSRSEANAALCSLRRRCAPPPALSIRRAHHHPLVVPAASGNFLYGRRTAGDAVVAVDPRVKAIVIGAIDRRGTGRAGAVGRRGRDKIEALEIPALLCRRGASLQLLESRTFGSIYRIEMRVRPRRLTAVETAN